MKRTPYHLRRCLAQHRGYRCQLEAGHPDDHLNTCEYHGAIHTIAWTDHADQLAQIRRLPS